MTMTKQIAQMRISRDLRDTEEALDIALLKQAELFSMLVRTRGETGSEPFTGQEALLRLCKTQQNTLSAGGELARVHSRLLDIGRDERMINDCPENKPIPQSAELLAG